MMFACGANRLRLCHSEQIFDCDDCFPRCFMSHPKAEFWDYDLNVDIIPTEVFQFDSRKFYFKCGDCLHSFPISCKNIQAEYWCPYCTYRQRCSVDSIFNCEFCFANCFMSHPKAEFWDLDLNQQTPLEVSLISSVKYYFKCITCLHSFPMSCNSIEQRDRWCPFCPNLQRCSPNEILSCEFCFANCFMSHPKAEFWDLDLNELTPLEVALKTGAKYYFKCDVCRHSFPMDCKSIARDQWCPYCSHQKLCPVDSIFDCDFCFANCFMSHPRAEFWDFDMNGDVLPSEIFMSTSAKYYFQCEVCHYSFPMACCSIAAGKWCPACQKKTQRLVFGWLQQWFGKENVKWETKYDWCRSSKGRFLPFDISVELIKLIVEVDGRHHFATVKGWKSDPNAVRETDVHKMQCALSNGFKVIRLYQEEVWKYQDVWKLKLKEAIQSSMSVSIQCLSSRQNLYQQHAMS